MIQVDDEIMPGTRCSRLLIPAIAIPLIMLHTVIAYADGSPDPAFADNGAFQYPGDPAEEPAEYTAATRVMQNGELESFLFAGMESGGDRVFVISRVSPEGDLESTFADDGHFRIDLKDEDLQIPFYLADIAVDEGDHAWIVGYAGKENEDKNGVLIRISLDDDPDPRVATFNFEGDGDGPFDVRAWALTIADDVEEPAAIIVGDRTDPSHTDSNHNGDFAEAFVARVSLSGIDDDPTAEWVATHDGEADESSTYRDVALTPDQDHILVTGWHESSYILSRLEIDNPTTVETVEGPDPASNVYTEAHAVATTQEHVLIAGRTQDSTYGNEVAFVRRYTDTESLEPDADFGNDAGSTPNGMVRLDGSAGDEAVALDLLVDDTGASFVAGFFCPDSCDDEKTLLAGALNHDGSPNTEFGDDGIAQDLAYQDQVLDQEARALLSREQGGLLLVGGFNSDSTSGPFSLDTAAALALTADGNFDAPDDGDPGDAGGDSGDDGSSGGGGGGGSSFGPLTALMLVLLAAARGIKIHRNDQRSAKPQ